MRRVFFLETVSQAELYGQAAARAAVFEVEAQIRSGFFADEVLRIFQHRCKAEIPGKFEGAAEAGLEAPVGEGEPIRDHLIVIIISDRSFMAGSI